MTISERIAQLLQARAWSQHDLSHRSGIPQPTIHRILNGTDPRLSTIEGIAGGFGLTVSEFLSPLMPAPSETYAPSGEAAQIVALSARLTRRQRAEWIAQAERIAEQNEADLAELLARREP